MKMEHTTSTVNLLQSTQDTINSHIKLNIDNGGIGVELKECYLSKGGYRKQARRWLEGRPLMHRLLGSKE